jgi:hypothetical protein
MKTNRKTLTSTVAAVALAAAVIAASGPVFAQESGAIPVRYHQRAGHAYQPSQSQDIYQSNAQGRQPYTNPDRDYFSGANAGAEY